MNNKMLPRYRTETSILFKEVSRLSLRKPTPINIGQVFGLVRRSDGQEAIAEESSRRRTLWNTETNLALPFDADDYRMLIYGDLKIKQNKNYEELDSRLYKRRRRWQPGDRWDTRNPWMMASGVHRPPSMAGDLMASPSSLLFSTAFNHFAMDAPCSHVCRAVLPIGYYGLTHLSRGDR